MKRTRCMIVGLARVRTAGSARFPGDTQHPKARQSRQSSVRVAEMEYLIQTGGNPDLRPGGRRNPRDGAGRAGCVSGIELGG